MASRSRNRRTKSKAKVRLANDELRVAKPLPVPSVMRLSGDRALNWLPAEVRRLRVVVQRLVRAYGQMTPDGTDGHDKYFAESDSLDHSAEHTLKMQDSSDVISRTARQSVYMEMQSRTAEASANVGCTPTP